MSHAKQQAEIKIYRRSSTWRIALSQFNSGVGASFMILVGYMSYLMNAGYGVTLAVAGVILSVTRIFDGVINPFLSLWMDRVNTRFGKLRIFIMGGWVVRIIALLFLFVWGAQSRHTIIYFLIFYILYILGTCVSDIAGQAIPPVLTNDPKQRPMVGVWSTVFNYLLPMASVLLINLVVLPRFGNKYSLPMLSMTCVSYILISFPLEILCCVAISKIDKPENFLNIDASKAKSAINFKAMWSLLKDNHPFQLYTVSSVAVVLAQQVTTQSIISTMLNGILIGNIQIGTIIQTIAMLPAIVFAILGGITAGHIGNRRAYIIWMASSLGANALMFFVMSLINMKTISTSMPVTIMYIIATALTSGTAMAALTANTAMRADIVDYELDRSGHYMPNTVSAAYNFVNQIISSLGSTIAAAGAAAVGFNKHAPQPTDAATPAIKFMTLFLYYGLPIIAAACALIILHFYKLDQKAMKKVETDIAVKKHAILAQRKVGKESKETSPSRHTASLKASANENDQAG